MCGVHNTDGDLVGIITKKDLLSHHAQLVEPHGARGFFF
jgi:hypothetical protein